MPPKLKTKQTSENSVETNHNNLASKKNHISSQHVDEKMETYNINTLISSYFEINKTALQGTDIQNSPNSDILKTTACKLVTRAILKILQDKSEENAAYSQVAVVGLNFYYLNNRILNSNQFSRIAMGIILIPQLGPCLIHLGNRNKNIYVTTENDDNISFIAENNKIHIIPLSQINKIKIIIMARNNKNAISDNFITPDLFPDEFLNHEEFDEKNLSKNIDSFFEKVEAFSKKSVSALAITERLQISTQHYIQKIIDNTKKLLLNYYMPALNLENEKEKNSSEADLSDKEYNIKKNDNEKKRKYADNSNLTFNSPANEQNKKEQPRKKTRIEENDGDENEEDNSSIKLERTK